MIRIKENLLSVSMLGFLKYRIESPEFPWYYLPNSSHTEADGNILNYSFNHLIFANSPTDDRGILSQWYDVTNSAALVIKDAFELHNYHIMRLRWGMTTSANIPHRNNPHKDHDMKHKTILYYIGTYDGDTYFYNDKKEEIDNVTPKINRGVMFDGTILHSSSKPVKYGRRIVLNINLQETK